MTLDDDFVRLRVPEGNFDIPCKKLGLDWPPPETIEFLGQKLYRHRYSSLTDEDMEGMTRIARGAEYFADEYRTKGPK